MQNLSYRLSHHPVDKLSVFNAPGWKRLCIFLTAALLPLLILKFGNAGDKIDPVFIYLFSGLGIIFYSWVFQKSLAHPQIPFLGLMMILFWVFLDKKYFRLVGIDTKLFVIIFASTTLIAISYFFQHFAYLWKTYAFFRYSFIFFLITITYLVVGYYTDFRLSTDLMSRQYAKAGGFVGAAKDSQTTREFGDFAKYVLWIKAIIPMVCITTGLTLFRGKGSSKPNSPLISIIHDFNHLLLIHYILSFVAVCIGTSYAFSSLGGDVEPGSMFILPLFLFFLIGAKYYFYYEVDPKIKPYQKINTLLNINIILTFLMIASISTEASGSSSMSLALFTGLGSLFLSFGYLKYGLPILAFKKLRDFRYYGLLQFLLFAGVSIALILYFVYRLYNASGSDSSSFNMRLSHWRDIFTVWYSGLSLKTLLFGFGLDKVLETVYYMSFSSPVEKGLQSPHNYYFNMIFDCGFMSIPFFVAFLSIIRSSYIYLADPLRKASVRIFSAVSLASVLATMAVWLFLDMPLFVNIILFTLLAFLEACKKELQTEEVIHE